MSRFSVAMNGNCSATCRAITAGWTTSPGTTFRYKTQDGVGGQECLRQDQAADRAVVEGPLQPLGGRRLAAAAGRAMTNRASEHIRSARIGFRL